MSQRFLSPQAPCQPLHPEGRALSCVQTHSYVTPSCHCQQMGLSGPFQQNNEKRTVLFPRAANGVAENSRTMLSPSSGGWKSKVKVSAGPRSLRNLEGGILLCLFLAPGGGHPSLTFLGLQVHRSKLPFSSMWLCPCVSVSSCGHPSS